MKSVQTFSSEYLELCKELTSEQIAKFLDDFRQIHAQKDSSGSSSTKSKLISMKVPRHLLHAFKEKCKLVNIPYQTQIKKLMTEWME